MEKEKILEKLNNLYADDLVPLWNEYCEWVKCFDDVIYLMGEVDDLFAGFKLSEFLSKISTNFNFDDDFFSEGVNGLESYNYLCDSPLDLDDLADFLASDDGTELALEYGLLEK